MPTIRAGGLHDDGSKKQRFAGQAHQSAWIHGELPGWKRASAIHSRDRGKDQLKKMGYLERDTRVSRGLRLTEKVNEIIQVATDTLRVPILGPIAAGPLMLVPEPGVDYMNEKEYNAVEIARSLLPSKERGNDLYALEVRGDSMIDAMINDGDIVVMKPAQDARNGEMVAVRVNDEYTLKYFFKEKSGYRLQPANPTMKPIMLKKNDPIEINGKVVMVIRKMPLAM